MLTSIPPRPDFGYTATGLRPTDTAGQEARSPFPEPAVKFDLSTALRVEGLSLAGSDTDRSRPLIVSLISGFAAARRAGQAIRAAFSAMKTEVQTLALNLVEQRAEDNRRGAAMLSLLVIPRSAFPLNVQSLPLKVQLVTVSSSDDSCPFT